MSREKKIYMNRFIKIILGLIVPVLIVIAKPLGMDINQSIVLGSLLFTIICWATGIINKDYAAIFMIFMFLIFGRTPINKVLFFPLSDNIILVVASFLLSQGIVNSGVADKFSNYILSRYCKNAFKLVIMSFILGVVLIFIIPQPFPRVILLASIYIKFLNDKSVEDATKQVLIFSIFVAATVTSMLFKNGDILLNYAVLKFGETDISYVEWIKYMTFPTLITVVLVAALFIFTFKSNIFNIEININKINGKLVFSSNEKKVLVIMSIVIILWMAEGIHPISAANAALIGTLAMFAIGVLKASDFNTINISLLLFLTAEFSIGKVLKGSGIAHLLSNNLIDLFPSSDSIFYLPFIIILIMCLHMVMGSLLTSLSVTIPALISIIPSSILSSEVIVLLTYVSVIFHFLMPYQNVIIMVGFGNGYYGNKHTFKLGIGLTILTFIIVIGIYLPWWKIIGIL